MHRNPALLREILERVRSSNELQTILGELETRPVSAAGLPIEARALVLAAVQSAVRKPVAVVVAADSELNDFVSSLRLFHAAPERVVVYPNPSLTPYQEVAPALAVVRDEIRALAALASGAVDFLVLPPRALFSRLPSPAGFRRRVVEIRSGDEIDPHSLVRTLLDLAYVRADLVGEYGEFAFRGGILDVFSGSLDTPVRIEFFGDTIESIRAFDVETQRSDQLLPSISILPLNHFSRSRDAISALAQRLSADFPDPRFKRDVAEKIEHLQEHGGFTGFENFLPVVSASISFADLLDSWLFVTMERQDIETSLEKFEILLRTEYEAAVEKGRAVYPPEQLVAHEEEIVSLLQRAEISFEEVQLAKQDMTGVRFHATGAKKYFNRLNELPADLTARFNSGANQLLFIATKGGREKTERLLAEFAIPFSDDPPSIPREIGVTSGLLPRGFDLPEANLSLLSEWDLFEPPAATRVRARKRATEAFVTDLRDLKVGDYIVHVDHGVGRFRTLQRIPFGETDREVMELEYANGGKLLLPMESLNLIQKYSGGGDTPPRLDKLGGTSWARTKASVKKAMRDMADELLKLYATRQMITGHAFGKDTPWQFEFEEAFEFEETDDQLTAIEDVKRDMESRRPMDRLLCGDVGYGKTEVAMRAAFKAVMDGRQVAMLAPTTILAFQHYRTFLRRFASYPVTIELLSRLRNSKEQKEIASKISEGQIDVVIGTHRLLSKDVKFKDLGLVVIDEEQRFGVAQKERLKQIKKTTDVLAMSATPIPRTLHMSLVGIRDISVIETPPKDRLAIQTAVVAFDDEFIREAIEFELNRGGQIFFVHNRIESIYAMKELLERLLPDLRIAVGHGQMDEKQLEDTMQAFIAREYDVLLATTIIENGIDIPACNTILINHAERFGLSQLYQLRGRVGRSDRLAFCYLLVPSERVLSADAKKRLAAIQEFSDLGAGFRIAARDLEIRGAGNILGGEQSGQIAAVGFEMYTKLLEETVRELKGEPAEEQLETAINLALDIYIPHDYIEDENIRMVFYKKIASAGDSDRVDAIRNEMRDRFGALPHNAESLLRFMKLKLLAQEVGVLSIVREGTNAAIRFQPSAKVDPNKLLQLLATVPGSKFTPTGVLLLPLARSGSGIIEEIQQMLTSAALAA